MSSKHTKRGRRERSRRCLAAWLGLMTPAARRMGEAVTRFAETVRRIFPGVA